MTREAKIGMLTGLGVIVLIGVLLSEYLGDRNTGPALAKEATGGMAKLPVGEGLREQILAPNTVPPAATLGAGWGTGVAAGPASSEMPLGAFATDTGAAGNGPVANGPAVPVVVGSMGVEPLASAGGPPVISLRDTVPVRAGIGAAGLADGPASAATSGTSAAGRTAVVAAAPVGPTYTIAAGDTLMKIAKKFYGSTKNADIARIVAANPKVLKNANTQLSVNTKIVVPNVAKPVAAGAVGTTGGAGANGGAVPAKPTLMVVGGGSDVVPLPSGAADAVPADGRGIVTRDGPVGNGGTAVRDNVTPAAPAAAKTYTVASGDTLEKIAKKIAPSKVPETVTKLVALNKIKDATRLQVGQVLKVPV